MDQSVFSIKTDVFEGPLDLLLHLIEKRKLLINDISLAQVTDDYIGYIKTHGEMQMGHHAHFILVASTLLLIKSKSLLPTIDLSEEEEQSISDLETRLRIHKRMKDVEPLIGALFFSQPSFKRRHIFLERVLFAPSGQINTQTLHAAIQSVCTSLPKAEKLSRAVVQTVVSLEEMITNLTTRIKQSITMSFKDFTGDKKDKVTVIVGFLALLELVKEGIIEASQTEHREDITIQTKEFDTPQYT